MRAKAKITLLLIAAIGVLGLLAGCGGSGGSDADPQQVLDDALGAGGDSVTSGVLDLSLDLASTGDQAGHITASIKGPFQSNGTGVLPSVDLDATANFDSAGTTGAFSGGLTLTSEGAYIGFEGKEYQLDDSAYQTLSAAYQQSAAQQASQTSQGTLQDFGVDPQSWVTDLSNEGTEDLDGTEVVHVSGTADVPKIISDLNNVAQQTGQAQQLDPSVLSGLQDTVSAATIDVYATTDGYALRRIDFSITLADPTGGAGDVTIKVSLGISDPNGDQQITAPTDALPFSDLLGQIPGGTSALDSLGG